MSKRRAERKKENSTGIIPQSASSLIKVPILCTVSLTPRKSTLWFLTVTPSLLNICTASRVAHVISLAWLKCVCSATCFPILRPNLATEIMALVQSSVVSSVREGETQSPFEAKRMRRMLGIERRVWPIKRTWSGVRRLTRMLISTAYCGLDKTKTY